jgi:hypothetical protein
MKKILFAALALLFYGTTYVSECAECDALEKVAIESVYKSTEQSFQKDLLFYFFPKHILKSVKRIGRKYCTQLGTLPYE